MLQSRFEIARSMEEGDHAAKQMALELYEELIREGNENACWHAGSLCHNDGDYARAAYYMKKLPTDSTACNILGMYYLNGMGTKVNKMMALTWFRRGALLGNAECQYEAGKLLMGQDDFECKGFLELALENGIRKAQRLLDMECN